MWHWLLQQYPEKFIYNVLKDAVFVAEPNLQQQHFGWWNCSVQSVGTDALLGLGFLFELN